MKYVVMPLLLLCMALVGCDEGRELEQQLVNGETGEPISGAKVDLKVRGPSIIMNARAEHSFESDSQGFLTGWLSYSEITRVIITHPEYHKLTYPNGLTHSKLKKNKWELIPRDNPLNLSLTAIEGKVTPAKSLIGVSRDVVLRLDYSSKRDSTPKMSVDNGLIKYYGDNNQLFYQIKELEHTDDFVETVPAKYGVYVIKITNGPLVKLYLAGLETHKEGYTNVINYQIYRIQFVTNYENMNLESVDDLA